MIGLLKRARYIYLVVFIIFVLSYGAGYLAGSLRWVNYAELMHSRVLVLSGNLEYHVPGYGALLRSYKTRHDQAVRTHLLNRDAWGMGGISRRSRRSTAWRPCASRSGRRYFRLRRRRERRPSSCRAAFP